MMVRLVSLAVAAFLFIGWQPTALGQNCACVTATLHSTDKVNNCPTPYASQMWSFCGGAETQLRAEGQCCYLPAIPPFPPTLVEVCSPTVSFTDASSIVKLQIGDSCYGYVWMVPKHCDTIGRCQVKALVEKQVLCPSCSPSQGGGEDDGLPQAPGDPGCGPQEPGCGSPILVSERGNRLELTDVEGGVNFDLNSDGIAERLAWTAAGSDDAFLALDRNINGEIDNGSELFGNFTPQESVPSPNGFNALAAFDSDRDGWITPSDPIFEILLFWTDRNHDGRSQADELQLVSETPVMAIGLRYRESRRVDRHGNRFRYFSQVILDSEAPGARRKLAIDVFFLMEAAPD